MVSWLEIQIPRSDRDSISWFFEFLKTLSFLNLKPSIIIPGFPRLVVNFSMANHQVNVSEGFANLTCI
jgi:ADP-dependent phosphofructokinase/glucokinase